MSALRALLLAGLASLLATLPLGADTESSAVGDKALAAFRAGDHKVLAAIAQRRRPDPWRVTGSLCDRQAYDAADALAGAVSPGSGRDGLRRYVAARRKGAPDAIAVLDRLVETARRPASAEDPGAPAKALADAQAQADALGWTRMQSSVRLRAGHGARRRGDFDMALRLFGERVALEERLADARRVLNALNTMATVQAMLGDYDAALAGFERARRLKSTSRPAKETAVLLKNIALLHERRGHYRKSLPLLEEGLALVPKAPRTRASLLLQLAGVHYQLGDAQTGLQEITEARRLFDALADESGIARCLGQFSTLQDGLRDYEAMYTAAKEAVGLFDSIADPDPSRRWFLAAGLTNLGYACTHLGQHDEARALQARALELARNLGDPSLLASIQSSLALAHLEAGDLPRAEALYTRVSELGEALASARHRMEGASGHAAVHMRQGRLPEAWEAVRQAIDEVSVQTAGLAEGQGAEARARHASIYRLAAQIAVAWEKPDALWEALERGRANALLESLSGRSSLRAQLIDPALRQEEDRLRAAERKAEFLLNRARAERGGLRAARSRRKELQAARSALRGAIGRAQRQSRASARLLYPRHADLDDVRKRLGAEDVLVLYALHQDPAVALVVRARGTRIVDLGPSARIREAAEGLTFSDAEIPVDPKPLHALLIAPLALSKKENLLVSPDGVLFRVPFATLVPEHTVTLVPSGSVHRLLPSGQAPPQAGILGVGNPTYAPGRRLAPLPDSAVEVKAIADVSLLGKNATLAGLKAALAKRERWRAVHFACHGIFDTRAPTFSGLELTDGRLTVPELFALELPVDLAVLSACETGRGTFYEGEGLVGLTRALMYAGAPRIICSLWKVDDAATRALMLKFYELWNPTAKTGAAAALQRAQAYVRGQPEWAHPYYWAAWVLWGRSD